MALALFDLDNTLIATDSDHGWGEFLCRHGYVDAQAYKEANDEFYRQYEAGTMNVLEYLEFSLKPLADNSRGVLDQWHRSFMQEVIAPAMLPKAFELLQKHRDANDEILVITSTNRFVVEPIVAQFKCVDGLLATELEQVEGQYTGKIKGEPCYRHGKVNRMREWLEGDNEPLKNAYFYSDSINDLPLMCEVEHPVAVDPDPALRAEAEKRGWSIISLR